MKGFVQKLLVLAVIFFLINMSMHPAGADQELINHSTSATYNHPTSRALFAPPDGKSLLVIGQTKDGIDSYDATFNSDPFGITLYTTPDDMGALLYEEDPDGVGIQDAQSAMKNFPNSAIFVGYYFGFDYDYDIHNKTTGKEVERFRWDYSTSNFDNVKPRPCLTGRNVVREDKAVCGVEAAENVRAGIKVMKSWNRPVFLRIAYEAEGPWNGHDPEYYKSVWKLVTDEIKRQQAKNIATVWQIAAACFPLGGNFAFNNASAHGHRVNPKSWESWGNTTDPKKAFEPWYPGDDKVDWTGISYFSQDQDCSDGLDTYQVAVDYLKTKGKPIIVAEATPRGMDLRNNTMLPDPNSVGGYYRDAKAAADLDISEATLEPNGLPIRKHSSPPQKLSDEELWNRWYKPFFGFVHKNREWIRAVSYINDNWTQYNRWQCDIERARTTLWPVGGPQLRNCAEGYWGNTQLSENPLVTKLWREKVLQDELWMHGINDGFAKLHGWCERFPNHVVCKNNKIAARQSNAN